MTTALDISSGKPTYTIAVRSLVEFVLRSGDLRYDFLGSVSAVEGIRAHQQIQRKRPLGYQAEVPVNHVVENDDFRVTISGRIDGVLVEEDRVVVEEIKSTRRSLSDLERNPNALHWGQARCYAYLWALENDHSEVIVRLTYLQMDGGRMAEFERSLGLDALKAFFDDLVERYLFWLSTLADWNRVRDRSIEALEFPFDAYRQGQREMAVAVYRNIRKGGRLLLQAATGIGKTMGALYPSIKALGEQRADKIVFLTARTTGRHAAESALERLLLNGLRLKSITITAKDKICFYPDSACVPEECPCAEGHFDRINEAIAAGLETDAITRQAVEKIARSHMVCPFELTLELVNWCDCVICDYNYAFAPGVMLQRLFGDEGGHHGVLVDEAHNLVDRSREMFSARLTKTPLLAMRRTIKDDLPAVYRSLGRINSWLASARRCCKESGGSLVSHDLPEPLIDRLKAFLLQTEKWLTLNLRTEYREQLLEIFFDVVRFVKISEAFDASYAVIQSAKGDELTVKLYCIDPSSQLEAAWNRCRSAVLFSATLTPAGYFQNVLGCGDDTTALNLPSPFPAQNLGVYLADSISTLYRERERSSATVVRAIKQLVQKREGHYLVFFPSYEYLRMVHDRYITDSPSEEILVQSNEMTEEQRDAFLERFEHQTGQTLVGFAVLGGIFGEGIDLIGERLTGAVIVGVGLPGICTERDLIRDHFQVKNGFGFEFAYQYPGITRVLQAAGRVIRSETDRGVLLLIDRRYRESRYRYLLPDHWRVQRIQDAGIV